MEAQPADTVTIRLTSETKAKLAELSQHTRRAEASLAGEAIAGYVERELAVVAGIHRGLADMAAGRVTPHDDVMVELDDVMAAAPLAGSHSSPR